MSDFRWSSLQDLFAIQEKMNRLFEETIHRTEFPDEVILSVELPGVELEDVHLEALDGKLRVSGVRRAEEGVPPRQFVRMERIYGSFSRDFSVPASIDPSRIKATLKSGILRVTAGKSERAQPIPVEVRKR